MVSKGWSLVWRRQRLLWWVFVLTLALGYLATRPLALALGPALDHSLYSDALYHHFSLEAFGGLLMRPDINITSLTLGAIPYDVVFVALMLLLTGGILKVYNEDRTFQTGEFFGACGAFFWRFLRLLILLLLTLIPVALIHQGLSAWSKSVADRDASPWPSVTISILATLFVLFLLMAVRLWIDMAEVEAVASNERAIRRSYGRAFRLTWRNFGSLFWIYFRLSLLNWIGFAVVLWIWAEWVPHQAVNVTLVLTQFMIFLWIFTRLWQRASETAWYLERAPQAAVVEPAPAPSLEPSVMAA